MAQSANLGWSGYGNGEIPNSMLASVGNGQLMEPRAAAQMNAALADMRAAGFRNVYVLEGDRSLATQRYLRDGYERGLPGFNVAAIPGRSVHGWALAADLAGDNIDEWGSAAQNYWQSIEARYGYSSAQGRADGEAWHKVCVTWLDGVPGSAGQPPTEEEDDDMDDVYFIRDSATGSKGVVYLVVIKTGKKRALNSLEWTRFRALEGAKKRAGLPDWKLLIIPTSAADIAQIPNL